MTKYDIIIVTVNNNKYLFDCIESILLAEKLCPTNEEIRVTVVANGCTEETNRQILEYISTKTIRGLSVPDYLSFNVIKNELMASFAAANNIGIKNTDGEFVLILNDDTVVVKDGPVIYESWLRLLSSQIDGRTVCVGPVGAILDLSAENKIVYNMDADKNCEEVDYIALCCAMVDRCLFHEIGYLDEGYRWALWEDVDFGVRIQKAGYVNRVFTYNGFHHYGHATIGEMDNEVKRTMFYKNRGYFIYKHGEWLGENK